MTIGLFLSSILGDGTSIRVVGYDGSEFGPAGAATTVNIVSPDAIQRIIGARAKEIGFSRAIIAGEIEIEGDIFGLFDVTERLVKPRFDGELLRSAAEVLGLESPRDFLRLRPLPPPPEEVKLAGRLHSRPRDAAAISSHYDVSNEFYDLILGPSMTYSCAVFDARSQPLDIAQSNKHDLVARKLGLEGGMRYLDIGCGWGEMLIHAARYYDVRAVGVTISNEQAERARKRVAEAGLSNQIDVRIQDYREITDGPYDAISSVGMAEHVGGEKELREYFVQVARLLAPNGQFLNHAIARAPRAPAAGKGGFIQRYVFPDAQLHELGRMISLMADVGIEVRHMETLRLHYALTLRHWVRNLEDNWDEAISEVGRGRALVWRLYMAGAAVAFERGEVEVGQILGVHSGQSHRDLPLRPDW